MPVRLTDLQLAQIAWAPATERTVALAARIGGNLSAVGAQRRRMHRVGGWHCPLTIATCTECRQPVLTDAANARTAHKRREPDRERRKSAERRAAGTMPSSTPYVAAWRGQRPDAAHALRVKERRRRRERERDPRAAGAPPRDDESRLAALDEQQRDEQAVSRDAATSHYAPWTSDDDDILRKTLHLPLRDVAARIGRTLYAVKSRRHWLREHAAAPPPHRVGDDTPPERVPRYGPQTRRP